MNALAHHLQGATLIVLPAVIVHRDDGLVLHHHTVQEIEHPPEMYQTGDREREQEHRLELGHQSERERELRQELELLLAQEPHLEREHRLGGTHQGGMTTGVKDKGHLGEMIHVDETQGERFCLVTSWLHAA